MLSNLSLFETLYIYLWKNRAKGNLLSSAMKVTFRFEKSDLVHLGLIGMDVLYQSLRISTTSFSCRLT
jgi:hypothetical protein